MALAFESLPDRELDAPQPEAWHLRERQPQQARVPHLRTQRGVGGVRLGDGQKGVDSMRLAARQGVEG